MTPGARVSVLAMAAVMQAGCTVWVPALPVALAPPRVEKDPFDRADALAERHDYEGALAAYEEIAARNPQAAPRARLLREVIGALVKVRADLAARDAELESLRQNLTDREGELAARDAELARLQREVTGRETEVGRLKSEITSRQAEITRLTAESEQLRADLDQLKRLELRLEQRRRTP